MLQLEVQGGRGRKEILFEESLLSPQLSGDFSCSKPEEVNERENGDKRLLFEEKKIVARH